jgi:hypothetical protein
MEANFQKVQGLIDFMMICNRLFILDERLIPNQLKLIRILLRIAPLRYGLLFSVY